MQDTYDPFSYLLSEIRAHDAGLREDWDARQLDHYLELLLVEEAQEIAWGRRHITVVHGEGLDDVEADFLDELFSAWEEVAHLAEWSRIGGVPDHHLTLTVASKNAEQLLNLACTTATELDPGSWTVVMLAVPSLTGC